jgi:hypothetical protein
MTKPKNAATERIETPEATRDVVAAVSYRADGKPDQSEGYVVIGEPEAREDD